MRKNGATTLSELIKTNAPKHIIEAQMTREAALRHRCPFCCADAGQECRSRTSGQDVWPHMRRISLTRPTELRQPAKRVTALCCTCGNLRTVSGDYHRYQDPEHAESERGKAEGWRKTQALKCDACGEQTRHALLHPSDARYRDYDEKRQRYILGGEWDGEYAPDRERLRAEYFAQFPRNPNLHHRFWIDEADKLRAAGETHMAALCGAVDEIPRSWGKSAPEGELVKPGRIDWDTEYEDAETGEWWIDMQCVDCLRVANEKRFKAQRNLLLADLLEVSNAVENLDAAQVRELREHLARLMYKAGT